MCKKWYKKQKNVAIIKNTMNSTGEFTKNRTLQRQEDKMLCNMIKRWKDMEKKMI